MKEKTQKRTSISQKGPDMKFDHIEKTQAKEERFDLGEKQKYRKRKTMRPKM